MAAKKSAKRATGKKVSSKAKKSTVRSAPKKAAASADKKIVIKRITMVKEPLSKSNMLNVLADATGLTRKNVGSIIEELSYVIERHLKKGGPGVFVLPGLLKCEVKHKPATKARKGINPFTGEEVMFKARPARNIVKVRALKRLKDMVA